jgi:aminoglycoside phosphotransferase (APT) family kinase protein
VRRETGESRVGISGLRRLAGGSSRQVWSVDVSLDDAEPLALVLRINPTPEGARASSLAEASGGFDAEFQLLQAVHGCGAPVPKPWWSCTAREVLGGPFYLMERIEGETIPRRIYRADDLAQARERLPEQLGQALARIHSTSTDELSWLPGPAEGRSSPEEQVESIRRGLDASPGPAPVLELALRWLEQNVPDERGRTLVHGDFRIGNVVVGADGLRAVLDWELAHIGDPHEDLAWMCTRTWRFGNVDQPVGGLGLRDPFYAAYEKESGRTLDRDALRYWELLGSAKVAVVWIFQVQAYLSGANPSVEQAAIGRRKAETDHDLLELLEGL